MKKSLLILSLFAFTTAVFAEEANPKLALAREVITALQADKVVDGMLTQLKQMAKQSTPISPDATPEQKAKAEKIQSDIMEITMAAAKKMIGQLDQLYAEVYSESELQAMKSFFSTPEGKSMISKQPELMKKMMPLIQQMQQELMPQVQSILAAAKNAPTTPATP